MPLGGIVPHSGVTRTQTQLSRKLVDENPVICVESLTVKNRVRNHKLAKSISDAGREMFCTPIEYKAEWEGKTSIEVDSFSPCRKTCDRALHQLALSLEVRNWQCSPCGTLQDRDVSVTKNIQDKGLQIWAGGHLASASGERVRPSKGIAFTRHLSIEEKSPSGRRVVKKRSND